MHSHIVLVQLVHIALAILVNSIAVLVPATSESTASMLFWDTMIMVELVSTMGVWLVNSASYPPKVTEWNYPPRKPCLFMLPTVMDTAVSIVA
jgi:hypothetical protein